MACDFELVKDLFEDTKPKWILEQCHHVNNKDNCKDDSDYEADEAIDLSVKKSHC